MSDKKSKTPKKKQESAPTRTMARPGTVEVKANKKPSNQEEMVGGFTTAI